MKKNCLFIIVVVLVMIGVGVGAYFIYRNTNNKEDEILEYKELSNIEGYGITLSENDTELYKKEYEALKENLTSGNINYEEYAKSVAKLFIIDLYTINNKINKYEIGGIELVLPDGRSNYSTNIDDTIYKYVEDNSHKTRNQELPEVKSVDVVDVKKSKFKIKATDTEYESYVLNLKWDYVVDMGYDTKAEIIIINVDNKLYVVEKN